MTKKTRTWIGGLLGVGVLVAVGWGAMPFGAGAQKPPSHWLQFNDAKCAQTCPAFPQKPGVECCNSEPLDPIIVRPK
ncbi:MAG: hypothetical protein OXG58_10390 [Gemmatimonadetes bacterium]|nr:hypothetical protein [Gemmatimonadota bacterium]